MFIKETVKTYAYRMLLSFKTSVTYKKIFNFTPNNFVRCEPALVGHNSIFARYCPMSVANIQACSRIAICVKITQLFILSYLTTP